VQFVTIYFGTCSSVKVAGVFASGLETLYFKEENRNKSKRNF
jgi:hypothetical protein